LFVIFGILLDYFGIGVKEFAGFGSLGTWLVYIGFVSIAIAALQAFVKKNRVVDERQEFVASKAMRVTFLLVVIAAFVVMVLDGLYAMTIPVHMLMSYFVCFMVLAYFISYHILLARY
jgi:hypothetical protein